jgi:hypothetical protein
MKRALFTGLVIAAATVSAQASVSEGGFDRFIASLDAPATSLDLDVIVADAPASSFVGIDTNIDSDVIVQIDFGTVATAPSIEDGSQSSMDWTLGRPVTDGTGAPEIQGSLEVPGVSGLAAIAGLGLAGRRRRR